MAENSVLQRTLKMKPRKKQSIPNLRVVVRDLDPSVFIILVSELGEKLVLAGLLTDVGYCTNHAKRIWYLGSVLFCLQAQIKTG